MISYTHRPVPAGSPLEERMAAIIDPGAFEPLEALKDQARRDRKKRRNAARRKAGRIVDELRTAAVFDFAIAGAVTRAE